MKSNTKENNTRTPKRSSSRLKRNPFSNLTNTPSTLNTQISKPKSKPDPQPVPYPLPATNDNEPTPCGPDKYVFFTNLQYIAQSEGAIASTSGQDTENNDEIKEFDNPTWFVDAPKKYKKRNVEDASSLSCPPITRTWMRSKAITRSNAHTVPYREAKKRKLDPITPKKLEEPLFPPEFVEKQKEYFSQIDSFELSEEEIQEEEFQEEEREQEKLREENLQKDGSE